MSALIDINAPRDPRALAPEDALPGDFVSVKCSFECGFVVEHNTRVFGKGRNAITIEGLSVRGHDGSIGFFPYKFVGHVVRDPYAQHELYGTLTCRLCGWTNRSEDPERSYWIEPNLCSSCRVERAA